MFSGMRIRQDADQMGQMPGPFGSLIGLQQRGIACFDPDWPARINPHHRDAVGVTVAEDVMEPFLPLIRPARS